jgi:uncharacterized protein YhbP (UPF0306 family)
MYCTFLWELNQDNNRLFKISGFYFFDVKNHNFVILIRKQRYKFQKGKLNFEL